MQIVVNTKTDVLFDDLYDKYSPVLYGLLLGLMSTKAQAEAVLIEVFEKVYRGKLHRVDAHCTATSLLQLTFITAYKRQLDTCGFLERFNSLPTLYRLLIGNINLHNFVNEPLAHAEQHGREISRELNQLRFTGSLQTLLLQN